MPLNQEHFDSAFKAYENDPELLAELRQKLSAASPAVIESAARMAGLTAELLPLTESEAAIGVDRFTLETIVRPLARPVLTIRDNRVTTEFLGPDSQVWAARIEAARSVLDRVIPAIGRVEVNNHPDFPWVGTGWLVADDIIVTNRHVAREFGRLAAGGFTFRTGLNGGPMSSRVDFLEEDQRVKSLEYEVDSVLWIAPASEPDVAFLRLARPATGRPLPSAIVLADSVNPDGFVVTIGYPARDPRVPDQDLVKQIFGDVYEKKRLAPGQILAIEDDELSHDCATLGGNSGSPVIDLTNGQALGLHFSGLYMQANFAVPAPRVLDLLRRVQGGELPGIATIQSSTVPGKPVPATLQSDSTTQTFRMQIPIEITVKVGAAIGSGGALPAAVGTSAPDNFANALSATKESLAGDPDVVDVRLGYRFKRGWITDERVVVVEVKEKLSLADVEARRKKPIPPQIAGVGVDVRTAALPEQLEHLGLDIAALEAPARPGGYREPTNISLELVKEPMRAVFHVSPDSGFPNLRAFLGRVRRNLTATMYEWDRNHISDAIAAAIAPDGRSLKMVTQRDGTEAAVRDMKRRLGARFKHVWASVGAGKLIPKAYHIKVAARDGEEFWLSSGNFKDSNQADIDPAGENSTRIGPLRQHNREWHAIIANPRLATMFQRFIEFDFKEAQRVPLDEGLEAVLPDVFIPDAAFMEGLKRPGLVRYFDPLVVDRELEIQPLLTPDRDGRGNRLFMQQATKMIKKGTRSIYVENQSFNLLTEGNNNDEFEDFFGVLRDKQAAGVDVRIIFRDAREFGSSNGPSQQKLLERLKEFGFDTDFIRLQMRCHTKGIIVDSREVMLGSHNLTNMGSLFNRDASLLVRDPQVARYFESIFRFDWDNLAVQEADELVGGMRIAQPGEKTPAGFRRVSLSELLRES